MGDSLLLPLFFLETLFTAAYVVVVVIIIIITVIIVVILVVVIASPFIIIIIIITITTLIVVSAARRGGKVLVFIVEMRPTRLRVHASATQGDIARGSLGQNVKTELVRSRSFFLVVLSSTDSRYRACSVACSTKLSVSQITSMSNAVARRAQARDPRSTAHDGRVSGRVPDSQGTPQREGTDQYVTCSDVYPTPVYSLCNVREKEIKTMRE